ncbi:MAG: hypothetical protein STSR0001_14130 [Methanothrix sp.]
MRKEMRNIAADEEMKRIREKCYLNLEAQVSQPIAQALEHLNSFAFNNALLPDVPAITISVDTFYLLIEPFPGTTKEAYFSKGIKAGRIFAKRYLNFLRDEIGVPQLVRHLLKGWEFFDNGANWGTFDVYFDEEQKKVTVRLENSFLNRKLENDKHKYCSFMEGYINGFLWICLKYYPRWFRDVTKFNPLNLEPISIREEPEGELCKFIVDLQEEELVEAFDKIYEIEGLIEAGDLRRIPLEIRLILEIALKLKLGIKEEERIYVPQLLLPFKNLKGKNIKNIKKISDIYAWSSRDAHFATTYPKEEIIKNFNAIADFLYDLELLNIDAADKLSFRTMALDARAGGDAKKKRGIFISYSHQDREFVDRLVQDLQNSGISIWIDKAEIMLGDSLLEKISEGIDKMDYLAIVLSPDSVNSSWVKKEVEIAMNQEIQDKLIKVLPLLYRKCDIPNFLQSKLSADFTEEERYEVALEMVLDRLR